MSEQSPNEALLARFLQHAETGLRRGVLVAESIWPNEAFEDGCGINSLTGADQPAPCGGGTFHDNSVWLRQA